MIVIVVENAGGQILGSSTGAVLQTILSTKLRN